MTRRAKSWILIGVLILLDLFALPWALFFLLTVQLHGLVQAPAIWLHSLSLFGGIQVIPRVCFTWFSLQIAVLALAVLAYCLCNPGGIRIALRRWLGIDPETLTGIIKRSIDQAIPAAIKDLPGRKEIDGMRQAIKELPTKIEVYKIVQQVLSEYAEPPDAEDGEKLTIQT